MPAKQSAFRQKNVAAPVTNTKAKEIDIDLHKKSEIKQRSAKENDVHSVVNHNDCKRIKGLQQYSPTVAKHYAKVGHNHPANACHASSTRPHAHHIATTTIF